MIVFHQIFSKNNRLQPFPQRIQLIILISCRFLRWECTRPDCQNVLHPLSKSHLTSGIPHQPQEWNSAVGHYTSIRHFNHLFSGTNSLKPILLIHFFIIDPQWLQLSSSLFASSSCWHISLILRQVSLKYPPSSCCSAWACCSRKPWAL